MLSILFIDASKVSWKYINIKKYEWNLRSVKSCYDFIAALKNFIPQSTTHFHYPPAKPKQQIWKFDKALPKSIIRHHIIQKLPFYYDNLNSHRKLAIAIPKCKRFSDGVCL